MPDIIPPMSSQDRQFEDGLKMVTYCPVCRSRYNPLEAKVVDENASAHLLHVRCKRCHSAILALILTNPFGISSVGLVTDLDSQEIGRFKEAVSITEDDVLNLYQYLHQEKELKGFLK